MSDINPVGGLASTTTLREFANQPSARPDRGDAPAPGDRVEISELALFLSKLAELPEDRARKVVEVRSEIARGAYETPEKLNVALDRLLEELGGI